MSITKKTTPVCNFYDEKQISESSKKLYISKLKKLNDGTIPTKMDFLKKKEEIMMKLNEQPLNTRRSSIIAIVSCLKDKNPDLHKFYTIEMDKLNKQSAEETKGQKSEKQTENWLSLEDLNKILEENSKLINSLKKKKKITEQQYDDLLGHVILSLYTKQAPRRSLDYIEMFVAEPDTNKDKNYYHNDHFYFNNFKTAKTYKQQVTKPPKEIIDLLKLYLKFKPKTSEKLLLTAEGKPLSNLSLRNILNKVTGKKISTQMLRNIYSTDKISPLIEKIENVAKDMGTSVSMVMGTYAK